MSKMNLNGDIRLVPGTTSLELTRALGTHLGVDPVTVRWKRFPDNNVDFTLDPQAVCGYDVFVVHTSPGGLEELLILLNHVRASKPRRLNIIVPYFFYARSDRNEPGKYALPTLM